MKKLLAGLGVLGFIVPFAVLAIDFETGQSFSLSKTEVIRENLYIASAEIVLEGAVTRDVVAAGGSIHSSGTVSGDLSVAGGQIDVAGQVNDDLRAAGGNITVQNVVGGDLVAAGGQVRVFSKSYIHGDGAIFGGRVTFEGVLDGDLEIWADEVFVNGSVGGDLRIKGTKITLGENAGISGSFNYSAPKEATIDSSARIGGKTNYTELQISKSAKTYAIWSIVIFRLLTLVFGALALFLVAPNIARTVAARGTDKFWAEVLRGLIVLIVMPVAVVLSLITVIGIPFGIALAFVYAALIAIGCLAGAVLTGSWLDKKLMKKSGELNAKNAVFGAVVYALIGLIPVVGWIASGLIFLAAFGALTHSFYSHIRK